MKFGIRILEYDRSRQRIRHSKLIRRHLNIKEYSENKILKIAIEFSKTRENIESAFNCTVEEMIFINMELIFGTYFATRTEAKSAIFAYIEDIV